MKAHAGFGLEGLGDKAPPHPVIVTIGDNRDYIRVLLYSYYTTGWGVLLRYRVRMDGEGVVFWGQGSAKDQGLGFRVEGSGFGTSDVGFVEFGLKPKLETLTLKGPSRQSSYYTCPRPRPGLRLFILKMQVPFFRAQVRLGADLCWLRLLRQFTCMV